MINLIKSVIFKLFWDSPRFSNPPQTHETAKMFEQIFIFLKQKLNKLCEIVKYLQNEVVLFEFSLNIFSRRFISYSHEFDIPDLCNQLTENGILFYKNILPTFIDILGTTADLIISCLTCNRYVQVRGMCIFFIA